MATRLKTVHHSFVTLASLTNDTLTNLTQTTIYLPETGTKTFKKVTACVTMDDIVTATGGTITTKTLNLRLGAAAYTSVANANALTHTGENLSLHMSADYTSHFTTNWTGTSMTCDFQLQINQSTGTTLGMVNVCVTLEITYEYDDTSTTQIKSVMIPLNMPVGTLATAATTYDTIPALDYYLPEADKVYRNIYVVVQGNEARNAATTDHTLTLRVGTANVTTGLYEGAFASDRFFRYVWDVTSAWPSKTATQTWQPTNTVARNNHAQAYLVVTYEFNITSTTTLNEDLDASETGVDVVAAANLGTAPYVISVDSEQMLVTSVASNTLTVTRGYNGTTAATHSTSAVVKPCALNAVMLPLEISSPMGGETSADYQRASRELFIQEPNVAPSQKMAAYMFFTKIAAIAGLNARLGTGSFVTYTDAASVMCGSDGLMIRNDSAFTLVRGRNTLNVDIYRTDTADFGWNLSGFILVNYISAVATGGIGAHNHTVFWNLQNTGTAALPSFVGIAATSITIPETNYFISAIGTYLDFMLAAQPAGYLLYVERLSAEGGVEWEPVYADLQQTDAEAGLFKCYSQIRDLFYRFTGEQDSHRMNIETSRRWKLYAPGNANTSGTGWFSFGVLMTYHTITSTVADSITGFTGTVTLDLLRTATGEKVQTTSRSGDGAFSFTWYDDTEEVFVVAYDAGGTVGRSQNDLAVLD